MVKGMRTAHAHSRPVSEKAQGTSFVPARVRARFLFFLGEGW